MKSYKSLTDAELRQDSSWDLIKLDTQLDLAQLQDWYYSFTQAHAHLKFSMNMTEYLDPAKIESFNENLRVSTNDIDYYTMSWPCDKDIPIPPISLANELLFPEVKNPNFANELRLMDKLKTGYMKTLYDMLGEDVCKLLRLSIHKPQSYLNRHTDGPGDIKMHIPILTNDDAYFYFGDDDQRRYVLEPGYMYILNTEVQHRTHNLGITDRVHLYTQPVNVDRLLQEF